VLACALAAPTGPVSRKSADVQAQQAIRMADSR
jgi:hypothetical protein